MMDIVTAVLVIFAADFVIFLIVVFGEYAAKKKKENCKHEFEKMDFAACDVCKKCGAWDI